MHYPFHKTPEIPQNEDVSADVSCSLQTLIFVSLSPLPRNRCDCRCVGLDFSSCAFPGEKSEQRARSRYAFVQETISAAGAGSSFAEHRTLSQIARLLCGRGGEPSEPG